MFNSFLNEKSTNKLKDYCKDKSVLIVGNSLTLLGEKYGNLIDSYDVVVRIGKGVPYKELVSFLGNKTDCWVFSTFRSTSYVDFKNARFKILNICQQSIYDEKDKDLTFKKLFFKKDFQIYRDYFLMGSLEDLDVMIKNTGLNNRLSQGIFCIQYFIDTIKTYKKLDIIGFDFFESTVSYRIDEYDKDITINSFHLPVLKNAKNPHYDLEKKEENGEKNYILNLEKEGKIGIHKMTSYPSEETLDILFSKFRTTGTRINKTDIT